MGLSKVTYSSALYFGLLSIALAVLVELIRYVFTSLGDYQFGFVASVIFGGVIFYLYALVAIALYNVLAKKYPISWEVKK